MHALIIGIGTTGLSILEELEALYYTSYKQESVPNNVQLLAIDTERRAAAAPSRMGSRIRVINIAFEDVDGTIASLSRQMDGTPRWLDECQAAAGGSLRNVIQKTTSGAAHVRAAGRLSLWSRFTGHDGIRPAIDGARQKMVTAGEALRLHVYVVGSLVGGTGSSIFLDIGFLVRTLVPKEELVGLWGILLAPVGTLDTTQDASKAKLANAYAALREAQFYFEGSGGGVGEDSQWPDRMPRRVAEPPYEFIFLAGSANLGLSYERVKELVALRLLLGVIEGIGGAIPGEEWGAGLSGISHRFATYGLAGFYHPRREIAEAAACVLGLAAIRLLLGDLNEAEVEKQALGFWGGKVNEYLAGLDRGAVEARIARAIDAAPDWGKFFHDETDRFAAGGPHFKEVEGNGARVVATIEADVAECTKQIVNAQRNLRAAETALRGIEEVTKALHAHWDAIGVPSPREAWDNVVTREIAATSRVTGLIARAFWHFEHREVAKERLLEVLKLMKLYILQRHLGSKIEDYARALLNVTSARIKLLTTDQGAQESVEHILTRRVRELCDRVGKNPYLTEVWHSSRTRADLRGFEQDVKVTLARAVANPRIEELPGGIVVSDDQRQLVSELVKSEQIVSRDLLGTEDLWGLLLERQATSTEIADTLKERFMQLQTLRSIPEVDVAEKVTSETSEAFRDLAATTRRGLIRLAPSSGGQLSLANRVQYLIGRNSPHLDSLDLSGVRVDDYFRIKYDDELRSYVLFLWERGGIDVENWLEDTPVWRAFHATPAVRDQYLFQTFDIDRRRRLKELEKIARLLVHVFIGYDPALNAVEGKLGAAVAIDRDGEVLVSLTDRSGIVSKFALGRPMPDDEACIGRLVVWLDSSGMLAEHLRGVMRTARGTPPWRDLINSFEQWAYRRFKDKVGEPRKLYFGEDNASGWVGDL